MTTATIVLRSPFLCLYFCLSKTTYFLETVGFFFLSTRTAPTQVPAHHALLPVSGSAASLTCQRRMHTQPTALRLYPATALYQALAAARLLEDSPQARPSGQDGPESHQRPRASDPGPDETLAPRPVRAPMHTHGQPRAAVSAATKAPPSISSWRSLVPHPSLRLDTHTDARQRPRESFIAPRIGGPGWHQQTANQAFRSEIKVGGCLRGPRDPDPTYIFRTPPPRRHACAALRAKAIAKRADRRARPTRSTSMLPPRARTHAPERRGGTA